MLKQISIALALTASTGCVSSELKAAISAYAISVNKYATASEKALQDCLNPPKDADPKLHDNTCKDAAAGYQDIATEASKLNEKITEDKK